ncbi:2-C-methyl-D-erythritol 4-phosphate cytidylyltransferase [Candidatus Peregrinibacteria bacterium]|nr:2-C-methyl-D-erythritol 4-phosphate cytidylyltransferase [Candidatus Peregrinibacteria bacterium]
MAKTIILAAGSSSRTKKTQDKLLVPINEKPLIYYTLVAFNDHPEIKEIVLVTDKGKMSALKNLVKDYKFNKIKKVVLGGENRYESFKKGLEPIGSPNTIILVHNAANPLVSAKEITNCIAAVKKHGAAIVAHKASSTIKEVASGKVLKTHDRSKIWKAQTPQASTLQNLKKAIEHAEKNSLSPTDEAMLLEAIGTPIKVIKAHENNFKITFDSDIKRLKAILGEKPKNYLVGIGQDSHIFEEKKKGLVLGACKFLDEPKLKANSDGDVLLHAISNALSQAIGEGSLGLFADKMCKEKGIKDSTKYIKKILNKVKRKGFKINNLGIMLECKKPKIDPISHELKSSLSSLLNIEPAQIGITATSGEHATLFGQGHGIQCFAIVSIIKSD